MKVNVGVAAFILFGFLSSQVFAQTGKIGSVNNKNESKKLFLDVHHLGAGKVTLKDVAGAHTKDLLVQGKHHVEILKYWVDESKGDVYCLASANNPEDLRDTHAEAHGLLPEKIFLVSGGKEEQAKKGKSFFLDIHELGAGKVTAKDVAAAHEKDLAVQKKYGVNLINYWFNEKEGVVVCLAQAKNSNALIKTHKEAHGLVPDRVMKVKQGE